MAAVFFVLFLIVQIGVPLAKLATPRPARFGWQMFSVRHQRVRFTLVKRDGTIEPLDLRRYLGQSRGEVDLTKALPPHLCRVVPDLAAVRITPPKSKVSQVYRCR